jgi:hypothetical protein
MKCILFCNLPYSFSILKPLELELLYNKFDILWYIPKNLEQIFPYKKSNYTTDINILKTYNSDAIFVPGNEVPYFLRGVKIQIFHGLAGEKKGHFRIRDYFDLYLTQGPYFTNKFKELSLKYKNFNVIETGWCKLDNLYSIEKTILDEKKSLLDTYNVKHIVLYAPTFSPSLTSGNKLITSISKLSNTDDILIIIKFHDKMDKTTIAKYKILNRKNIIISNEKDITTLLQISDLMISDTSSVVYEFLLLDKPVVTLNSISENINWLNLTNENQVQEEVLNILKGNDSFKVERKLTIEQYHPYNDGKSSQRMIDATISYIQQNGVPNQRKLSLLRKFKIWKLYK